jgi:[acyl-carrier-protein] S-malonyltransferase
MSGSALLFPGQGCAEDGMGVWLAERCPAAAAVFEEAEQQLRMPLLDLCRRGGPDLEHTLHQQPAVLACELAHLAAWETLGSDRPAAVAGHSLGQLVALVAAGAIGRAAALTLVGERARSMDAVGAEVPGAMSAVLGWTAEAVMAVCVQVSDEIWLAAVNGDTHVVISGRAAAVQDAGEALLAAGADRVVPLAITVAAHSPLMAPASRRLRDLAAQLPVAAPRITVPSNLDGQPIGTADDVRREIAETLTAPVRWLDCMHRLGGMGVDRFVELSPRSTLVNAVLRALPDVSASCPGPEQLAGAPVR